MTTIRLSPEFEALFPRWKNPMSDVADDIRKAVAENRTIPPAAFRNPTREPDDDFLKLRAKVRGTLIGAKHQLVPNGEWLVTDDRILDIVTTWLESQRK